MARKGGVKNSGPFKGLVTFVWFVVLAGAILGWGRANDITSFKAAEDYVRSWSEKADSKVDECVSEKVELTCEPGGSGAGAGNSGGGADQPPAGPVTINDAEFNALQNKLKAVPEQSLDETVDYDRGEWRHWSDLDGNGCDSREDVLVKQGKNVVFEAGDACRPESGTWLSPYEGKTITDPSTIDIDHVIPLGYAATHGGQNWPAAKKEQFANDFSHLLATSASTNRSKSDKGPGAYMPEKVTYWCTYSQIWINTASKYGLWLEKADKVKLEEGLGTC